MPVEQLRCGLVGFGTAHGSASAFTAQGVEVPATFFMAQSSTSPDVIRAMEQWGAQVIVSNVSIAEARELAIEAAAREGRIFIDPHMNSRGLIAGCATIVVEMLAGAVAATLSGKVKVQPNEQVGILISRAGVGGLF
jgi:threonine dehydratase